MEKEFTKEDSDSIKVSKSTTGKYSWDIKVYFKESFDMNPKSKDIIERIKQIHDKLKETFENEKS